MSGLCGLYFRRDRSFNFSQFSQMLDCIKHRGIDGQHHWFNQSVGLGIQKRYLTSESLFEDLPFYDQKQQVAILSDARIDNRAELFEKLNLIVDDKVITDSSLVLLAYKKWGQACVQLLSGDFIIVIWDEKIQKLFVISDPMGVRSLYYYVDDHIFAFASEVKALLSLPHVPRQPNLKKIAAFNFLIPDNHETYFDRIYSTQSASILSVSAYDFQESRYWYPDIKQPIHLNTEEEYVEAFQEKFEQSVLARLRSHYAVASTLSGGLDSSSVTAMAAHLLGISNKNLYTYSVLKSPEYADLCEDEQVYVDSLNTWPNLISTPLNHNRYGPFDNIEQFVWHTESPRSSARCFHFIDILASMKQHNARILLSGLYGEAGPSFSGQGYFTELLLQRRVGHLIDEIRARSVLTHTSFIRTFWRQVISPILKQGLSHKLRKDLHNKKDFFTIRPKFTALHLGEDLKYYHEQSKALSHVYLDHRKNQLNMLHYYYQQQKAPARAIGQGQIEITYPFLDRDLLTFCLAIPGDMKIKSGYGRYMIRAGMRDFLPEKILQRKKGLPVCPDYRFRYNKQRARILDFLASLPKNNLLDEIVDIERLRQYASCDMMTNFSTSKSGFIGMIVVPNMVYLLQFLKTFFIDDRDQGYKYGK